MTGTLPCPALPALNPLILDLDATLIPRMVAWINEKKYWQPALNQAREELTDAWVVNATVRSRRSRTTRPARTFPCVPSPCILVRRRPYWILSGNECPRS